MPSLIEMPHLNQSLLTSTFNGNDVFYQTARHYYLMGGKKMKDVLGGTIDAQVLMRTDMIKFSADINARYIYDFGNSKQGYGGLTIRTTDAVAFMFGYTPMENLTVGYSYDLTMSKIKGYTSGTHEIILGFCFNFSHSCSKLAIDLKFVSRLSILLKVLISEAPK